MRYTTFLILVTLTFSVHTEASQGADASFESTTPSELMAEELVRAARQATMSEPIDIHAIEAALVLATEATLLTPDDFSTWQVLHEVAQMADQQTLAATARENLLRLDPTATTLQLARLRDVVNRAQTVEERLAVYEQLLSESRQRQLDSRVAARLAFDAAELQRQLGDTTQFARWLAESVALDPAFSEAMTLATGFFGDETADVYRRAELLASTMLSNIRDITTQIALAEFLMAFGDYKDAQKIYDIILGENASNPGEINDNLLADIVLSQWAAGYGERAIDTLMQRQVGSDEKFRRYTQSQQPNLSPLELARIHAPFAPKLAVVRAAVFAEEAETVQAAMALESVAGSLLTLSNIYESQGEVATAQVIEIYLQLAWLSLWLDNDVETAKTLITQAETGATLDPAEKQRLEGWIDYHAGDLLNAKTKLLPLKEDPAAKAGLGLIFLEEGNKKAAALEFLSIAKHHGGTILGVWSRNQLEKIVGTSFHIREEVPQLQELMGGVIETLDTITKDPRPPIAIQLSSESNTLPPYQPVYITATLTNNTKIPLTIAPNGPIKPLLLIEADIEISGLPPTPIPPIVVAIDSSVSLKPRESLDVTVDLRKHWIGDLLNEYPLKGASISLKAIVNFSARETTNRSGNKVLVYEVGALGKKAISNPIRVNGVRLTDVWLKDAIEESKQAVTTDQLIDLVLLTHVVGDDVSVDVEEPLITPPPGQEAMIPEEGERHPLQDEAVTTVLTTFPKLDNVSQSWVLATMSNDPTVEAVTGMLKNPNSTLPQLAWLTRLATPFVQDEALDNARLIDALTSENEAVQRVAVWVHDFIQKVVKQRADQLLSSP